jgi:Flp pilus assembly protein TadG
VLRLIQWPRALTCRTARRRFLQDRRAAAAVEFALVSLPFSALVLFLLMLGYRLYVQAALDYVAGQAGRMLAVDVTQSRTSSKKNFQTLTLCPLLSPFLSCNNVTVSLAAVTDYSTASYTDPATPPFSTGQIGNYNLMLLHLTYTLPSLNWPSPTSGAVMTFLGTTVHAYYPYQNEY